MAGTWLLTVLLSGYSSLGAIVSALIAPFYVWWFKPQFTFPVAMLSCLILIRHHDNIQRLWRRQETKIWHKLKKKVDGSLPDKKYHIRENALFIPFIA
jgi:glycerol-3-phosphate acyltransferase PlsY